MKTITKIRFFHQNQEVTIEGLKPQTSILDYLREHRGLTGTKEGCNEGDCGACSVILAEIGDDEQIHYKSLNACVALLHTLHGKWLLSVEDLTSKEGDVHPVAMEMFKTHGSQCGFCTPGFVMNMAAEHSNDNHDIDFPDLLSGNLCRCTGYGPIELAAKRSFKMDKPSWFIQIENHAKAWLREFNNQEDLSLSHEGQMLYAPHNAENFARFYENNPKAVIIGGTTDVGLWLTKQLRDIQTFLSVTRVHEFHQIEESETSYKIGAAVSLNRAFNALEDEYPEAKDWHQRFASHQIRNAGTLVGNIANASPIGDSPPLLMVLGAVLYLRKGEEKRTLPIEDYFIAYGKQNRHHGEFIEAVEIPKRNLAMKLVAHKISRRRDQDITTTLFAASWKDTQEQFYDVKIAFGGMAATPKFAQQIMSYLNSTPKADLNPLTIVKLMKEDFQPIDDLRASAQYRVDASLNLIISTFWNEEIALEVQRRLAS